MRTSASTAETTETTEMRSLAGAVRVHTPLGASTAPEACVSCAAPLAADQRYCVQCGTRRAGRRMPSPDPHLAPALALGHPVASVAAPPRFSPGATLVAAIGSLLLAMGIGVFVGSALHSSPTTPQTVSIISSGSGAAAAPSAAAPTTSATPGTTTPTTTPGTTGATKSGTSAAAANPQAGALKKTPPLPPAVHVGSKGSGPGYQGGKFTGNFFGP